MSDAPATSDPDGPARVDRALAEVEREFVDLWRSMADLWGITPTMAQIHGLLFLTCEVLCMDDIMARLTISRGNVSMNLARLVEWGLVKRTHRPGDRREYYEALGDVWEMFTVVAAQRKRRELDPMLTTLHHCGERLSSEVLGEQANATRAIESRQRIDDLVSFLSLMDGLAQRFFESHRSLRGALELLAQKPQDRTSHDS